MNRTYYFSSEEYRKRFLRTPYYFLKDVKIPPTRLIFLGVAGSGKVFAFNETSLMKHYRKTWDVPVVQYKAYCVDEYAKTATPEIADEIRDSFRGILPLSLETLTSVIQSLFTREPYATKGFLLEGFPTNKTDLDVITKAGLLPDAFIFLKPDFEIAAKRKLKSRKEELQLLEAQRLAELKNAPPTTEGSPISENESDASRLLASDEKIYDDLLTK